MSGVEALLSSLRRNGVSLWLEGGKLKYRAPKTALAALQVVELRTRKAEIIGYLQQIEQLARRAPPLERRSRPQRLPLSYGQERLWLLEQLEALGPVYNVTSAIRLQGKVDTAALERAFAVLVNRHETLRTRFAVVDGMALQLIDVPGRFVLEIEDLSSPDESKRTAAARLWVKERARHSFDIETGPLFVVFLLRLSAEDHVVSLVAHHAVADEWSKGILIREIGALYGAFVAGKASPLAELPVQYADYALWQRAWLQGEVLEQQVSYWKDRLAGAPPALNLPTDRMRPAVQSFRGAVCGFALSQEISGALAQVARAEGATLFMVLLAAFQVVLSRWSGQGDIVVGTPIAGRTHRQTEGLIGFFVNMLALRTDLSGDPSFRELVGRVKEVALGAYAHQDLPFEKLVEALQPVRDLSRQPIFQILLALQNVPSERLELPGLKLSRLRSEQVTAKFDLSLYVEMKALGLRGYFEYATDLFDRLTIERFAEHFKGVVGRVVAAADCRLSELWQIGGAERHRLLIEWSATASEYPADRCVHDLFAEQAARTPDAVALVYEDQGLSYGELDRRANQLAHHLRGLGVGPEVVVGLCVERSLEMVVALLGILKAGGAYLPLDPSYPQERLSYMLKDAQAPVLVTQTGLEEVLPAHDAHVVRLDADWPGIAKEPTRAIADCVGPGNLAYVIYTSGSTGKPKGVMLAHGGMVNRIAAQARIVPFTDDDICCQKTAIGFVDAIFETLGPLCRGVALVVASASACRDPAELTLLAERAGVSRLITVPSLALALVAAKRARDGLAGLRSWTLSGEAVSGDLLVRLLAVLPGCRFVNLYGSSEVAADATCYGARGREEGIIPIGRPISNTQAYVLDGMLAPVPIGVTGELCIGGVGLARGYLRRPGLTAERFIPNPFGEGERLYRTGDLARWRSDGELEYLGRLDHQVKVRGFRIELGEIEAALAEHPGVKQAVVVSREEEAGERQLVAYVVGEDGAPDANVLRTDLKHSLPEYMVPARFVSLERLPLTPNGKVDRKGLPAPEAGEGVVRGAYVVPRTPSEEVLSGIWCEVLKLDRVGVGDNFFDLGGHSLLLAQLQQKLQIALGRNVSLISLFQHPTIRDFAKFLVEESFALKNLGRIGRERGQRRRRVMTQRGAADCADGVHGVNLEERTEQRLADIADR
jgi:amino acid adenylation domain-containing protein